MPEGGVGEPFEVGVSGFAEGVGVEAGADEGFGEEEPCGGLGAFGGGEEF